ncbi:MAG: hypothetical protein EHM35_13765 [Planctomycetaceae bacterium]|nr:MAG: hypothetical protein EHM35_13765 [Planctomycetaceae bacterium]
MRRANHWLLAALAAVVVTSWAASPARAVIPPDPDNAALLYYQAFISLADLDKEARDNIAEVARGAMAPTDKTREYVEKCRQAIGFADAARGLQVCNWGFRYSQGFEAAMPHLAQVRFLNFVLLADARIQAADGDYKGALDRCLQIGTLVRHIGDDPLIAYIVSVAVQKLEYQCMNDIIGMGAKDAALLQWLKNELVAAGPTRLSPANPLKIEMEISLNLMQMDKLDKLAAIMAGTEEQNKDMMNFLASANEASMERARQLYSEYVTSALAILNGSKPYEQAHRELTAPVSKLDPKDPASAIVRFVSPALASTLSAKTVAEAYANATTAGVEICLKRAEMGRFPEVLPEGLPKDPFSGQDFQYERTRTGFILRCRGKDLAKDKTYEYTFSVK